MSREEALNKLILVYTAFFRDAYESDPAGYRKAVVDLRDTLRASGFTTEEINANWWIDVHEREAFNANEADSK